MRSRRSLCFAIAALLPIANTEVQSAPAVGAAKPNIVFILADDMGFGDAHCNNPDSKIPTPNLDRLAKQGIRFTDAHTPSAVCTPTRYGLLTGRYCWRSRLKRGVLGGFSPPLLEPGRLTVASFLKSNGYYTGMVGKWHLGLDWVKKGDAKNAVDYSKTVADGPSQHGFDFSYVIPASLDMPPYVYLRDGLAVDQPTAEQPAWKFPRFVRKGVRAESFVMEDVLDHLLGQAVGYIQERAGNEKPFFLYFAMTAPHKPVFPHKRFRGKTDLADYGDFVVQVDWTVGQVLDALDRAGVADNTLVVYTSDNGSYMYRYDDPKTRDHVDDPSIQGYRPEHHRANYIYRGTKADIWEAGHRVPFLVRWPGVTKAGSECDATICLTDFMATCADVLDVDLPKNAGEDSFSILPHLRGESPATPRPPVIHHSGSGMFAIRDGKWKLVLGNGSGGRQNPKGKPFARPYHLSDMSNDPAEAKNLVEDDPEVAERLEKTFQTIHDSGGSRK